jgi:hypothetical protein
MEKVCAPNAILVFQIPQKVRSKEVEYNKGQQYPIYAFEIWRRYIQSKRGIVVWFLSIFPRGNNGEYPNVKCVELERCIEVHNFIADSTRIFVEC